MKQYNVTGMSCAACSARVEKAVSGVSGVTSCSVSLLTNSMGVEGSASDADIIKAVKDAGYGASVKGGSKAPLPSFMEGNHVMMGLAQLILAAIVMVINQKFFINGFKGLLHRSPNMDTLVAMGSAASFVYSTWALFAMTDAQLHGGIGMGSIERLLPYSGEWLDDQYRRQVRAEIGV